MINTIEDLEYWKAARILVNQVYDLCDEGPISSDYRLRSQLTSAAVSVMSNIAEGFARYHRRDFIRFLDIAQSSAVEVQSLLYVVLDREMAPANEIRTIQDQAAETRYKALGLLRHVRRKLEAKGNAAAESSSTYDPKV
jgi:four helix bundle protein